MLHHPVAYCFNDCFLFRFRHTGIERQGNNLLGDSLGNRQISLTIAKMSIGSLQVDRDRVMHQCLDAADSQGILQPISLRMPHDKEMVDVVSVFARIWQMIEGQMV